MKSNKKNETREEKALRAALDREALKAHKSIYGWMIEYREKHIASCKALRCLECKDAKVLLKYYQRKLKEGPL